MTSQEARASEAIERLTKWAEYYEDAAGKSSSKNAKQVFEEMSDDLRAVLAERNSARAKVAELEAALRKEREDRKREASATITRAITGEGEPGRYGSIPEMQADFARKRIAELEAALAQSQADAAAMMEALLLLPDGRAGSKTGRADYVAMVGGDVLLKCWQAAQDHAGQPLLDELALLRESEAAIREAAEGLIHAVYCLRWEDRKHETEAAIDRMKASLAAMAR